MSTIRILAIALLAGCSQAPDAPSAAGPVAHLAKCGVLMDEPTVLVKDGMAAHGTAAVSGWSIAVSESALREDRAFVEQELVPHEVAHLAHYTLYGSTAKKHGERFVVLEDYLRGIGPCPGGVHAGAP